MIESIFSTRDQLQTRFDKACVDRRSAEVRLNNWWIRINTLPHPVREITAVTTAILPIGDLVGLCISKMIIVITRNEVRIEDRGAGLYRGRDRIR